MKFDIEHSFFDFKLIKKQRKHVALEIYCEDLETQSKIARFLFKNKLEGKRKNDQFKFKNPKETLIRPNIQLMQVFLN